MLPDLIEAFRSESDCVMRWRLHGGGFICELPRRRRPWRARSIAEIIRICRAFEASEVSCTFKLLAGTKANLPQVDPLSPAINAAAASAECPPSPTTRKPAKLQVQRANARTSTSRRPRAL